MSGAQLQTERRIEFRDTDAAGIAHFTAFFEYMEEAEHALLRKLGLSVVMHDQEGSLSWPRVSAHCDYRSPVRFEDVLQIDVAVDQLGERSVRYQFTFRHQQKLVAEGTLTAVCCRLEGQSPPRSISIPPAIRAKLSGASQAADEA